MMSPQDFYNQVIGKKFDFDGWYGAQCWDGWAHFIDVLGLPSKYNKTITGWADGIWINRVSIGTPEYFNCYSGSSGLQDGDWCVWGQGSSSACPYSHVAMYYQGKFLGQNQNGHEYFTLVGISLKGILGYLRLKQWEVPVITKPEPLARDTKKRQIEVLVKDLRMRKTAGGESWGYVAKAGTFDVVGQVDNVAGYSWYRIQGSNPEVTDAEGQFWIARNDADGWTKLYEVEDKDTQIANLKAEIVKLTASGEAKDKQITDLTASLAASNAKIAKAKEVLE